jgi:predicted MFS family arabinose efflux permease
MEAPLRRNRAFVALWLGQAVSNLGISISSFAYPVVVLAETGSAVKAGAVGSVLSATAFFLRLPAGILVDRWSRRAILIACDAGRVVNAGAFALALALGHFWYAQVLLVAFFEAALGVLFGPAESAAVRRVVGVERAREAIAANASRTAVPGVLGPPLGGALLAAGRAFPFLADAVSYAASLVCILAVRTELGPDRRDTGPSHPVAAALEGLRWLRRDRFLRTALLYFMAFGLVLGSIGLVLLVLARHHGAGSGELGLMFALTAGGGVLGALATPRLVRALRPHVLMLLFAWLAAAATLSLLVFRSPIAYGAAGAVAFFFVPPLNAAVFGRIGERAPDALQGRATSAAIQVASLLGPVGPIAAGGLVAGVGARGAAAAYGLLVAALAAAATFSRALREA